MDKMHRLSRYNDSAAFAVCEWSSMGLPDASDSRLAALTRWVVDDLGFTGSRIEPASADASFRRYFRVTRGADTCIVMDAPPDKENVAPFVSIAQALAGMNLNVPLVLARDVSKGLLLLSDLGDRQYLDELAAEREVDRLYADALEALVTMQTAGGVAARSLPAYDRNCSCVKCNCFPSGSWAGILESPQGDPSAACWIDCSTRWCKPLCRSRPRSCIETITREICCSLPSAIPASWTFRMRCGDRLPTMRSLSSRTATLPGRRNGCGGGCSGTVNGWNVPAWEWEPMPLNSCGGST